MLWSKSSDWIPLDNAIAAVKQWQIDLQYAELWLQEMESRKINNKYLGFLKQYKLAVDDVAKSKKELQKAQLKLEESQRLELQGRT